MGGLSKPLYYVMFHIVHQLERGGRQVWLLLRLVCDGETCDVISLERECYIRYDRERWR
jgi:hypothetical protein